jgi:hypothetical protein
VPFENRVSPAARLQAAVRCHARSKRSGRPCRCPAVRGWTVCRMHGARGGAKPGPGHPGYKTGSRTKELAARRAWLTCLRRETAFTIDAMRNEDGG